jgi:hypothetical protein
LTRSFPVELPLASSFGGSSRNTSARNIVRVSGAAPEPRHAAVDPISGCAGGLHSDRRDVSASEFGAGRRLRDALMSILGLRERRPRNAARRALPSLHGSAGSILLTNSSRGNQKVRP